MVYKYCLAMGVIECAENYIFPGKGGTTHISQRAIQEWFETLLKDTGIFVRTEKRARGPCLHCFRHLFAVKSFAQAERVGRSEKYLKFNSDIFPEHTALFEDFSEEIFPEVCYEE